MAKILRLKRSDGSGPDLALGSGSVVGRGNASLGLSDPKVSREHFRVEATEQGFALVGLKSDNFLYINGKACVPQVPHPVHPGDTIGFGRQNWLVLPDSTAATPRHSSTAPVAPSSTHTQVAPTLSSASLPRPSGFTRRTLTLTGGFLVAACVLVFVLFTGLWKKSKNPEEIYRDALPSIVRLQVERPDGRSSTGSGFFTGDGHALVTNIHVVRDAIGVAGAKLRIFRHDGSEETDFTIRESCYPNDAIDICLLKTKRAGPPLSLRLSAPLVGEGAYAIGHSLGGDTSLGTGIVSLVSHIDLPSPVRDGPSKVPGLVRFTAPISPGNSGGPLLDSRGEVMAVTYGMMKEGQNFNLAHSSYVLHTLMTHRTATPYLPLGELQSKAGALAVQRVNEGLAHPVNFDENDVLTVSLDVPQSATTFVFGIAVPDRVFDLRADCTQIKEKSDYSGQCQDPSGALRFGVRTWIVDRAKGLTPVLEPFVVAPETGTKGTLAKMFLPISANQAQRTEFFYQTIPDLKNPEQMWERFFVRQETRDGKLIRVWKLSEFIRQKTPPFSYGTIHFDEAALVRSSHARHLQQAEQALDVFRKTLKTGDASTWCPGQQSFTVACLGALVRKRISEPLSILELLTFDLFLLESSIELVVDRKSPKLADCTRAHAWADATFRLYRDAKIDEFRGLMAYRELTTPAGRKAWTSAVEAERRLLSKSMRETGERIETRLSKALTFVLSSAGGADPSARECVRELQKLRTQAAAFFKTRKP